ncbi:hypothetical protein G6F22_021915 [Rhizopus arrhizus]|nr:hypothetical protein G6F22_021915 [Rhizopus arrhizus]KAG1239199.1 hypothetical protein G6F68_018688 [Rhizopus microsporus]
MPLFDADRQSKTASVRARWRACSVHALFRPEGPHRVGWLWRLLCGCRRWVDLGRSVILLLLAKPDWRFGEGAVGGFEAACVGSRRSGSVPGR